MNDQLTLSRKNQAHHWPARHWNTDAEDRGDDNGVIRFFGKSEQICGKWRVRTK